jgi:hypothetical protein
VLHTLYHSGRFSTIIDFISSSVLQFFNSFLHFNFCTLFAVFKKFSNQVFKSGFDTKKFDICSLFVNFSSNKKSDNSLEKLSTCGVKICPHVSTFNFGVSGIRNTYNLNYN